MNRPQIEKRTIAVLGSTGSIGINALEVIGSYPKLFKVAGLAAGNNLDLLRKQVRAFAPRSISVRESRDARALAAEFPRCRVFDGKDGLMQMVMMEEVDTVVLAVPGTDALAATLAAIGRGLRLCLANKEAMVAAGGLINRALENSVATIIPVDSEHSAIYQSLADNPRRAVRRIILTASGGPFFRLPEKKFSRIDPREALSHPVWEMGRKITIDSATLMNKALEMIEAQYLFHLAADQIDVLIHPQSIVHSLVEYIDSSVIAQLGLPDMKLPILYSLTAPGRLESAYPSLNLGEVSRLDFYPPDSEKFRSLRMARRVLSEGKNSGAVFNAANEVAVEAFLEDRISFANIFDIVEEILYNSEFEEIGSLEQLEDSINRTKSRSGELIRRKY